MMRGEPPRACAADCRSRRHAPSSARKGGEPKPCRPHTGYVGQTLFTELIAPVDFRPVGRIGKHHALRQALSQGLSNLLKRDRTLGSAC